VCVLPKFAWISARTSVSRRPSSSFVTSGLRASRRKKVAKIASPYNAIATIHGDHAYLGLFRQPECLNDPNWQEGGVWIVDVSDPTDPQHVGEIPNSKGTYAGEGIQVITIDGRDVLLHNNEICNDGTLFADPPPDDHANGGFSMWDVTDPTDPELLFAHAGDPDFGRGEDAIPYPVFGFPEGFVAESHSVHAWEGVDGRFYAVAVDNFEIGTDIDIFDISDPENPELIVETGWFDWPEEYTNDGFLGTDFIHDAWVEILAPDEVRMLVSYWDGGYVQLDVTDLEVTDPEDPENPVFISDTQYGEVDPLFGISPPVGNAHYAEYTASQVRFFATDENFDPFRAEGISESGVEFAATQGTETPPVTPDEDLAGPTFFVGLACSERDEEGNVIANPVPEAPTADTIAVIERGICPFTEKAQNVQERGYQAGLVFNDMAGCEAFVTMAVEAGIPMLFVQRSVGLAILDPDFDAFDPCVTPAPAEEALRFAGETRIETAIMLADESHPDGADTVAIARADDYADALAGGPLASDADAPILLPQGDAAPPAVIDAINDLGATDLVVLGGPEAVSDDVVDQIVAATDVDDVDRIGGENRFHTAALMAAELDADHAFVVEGGHADPRRGWPDAVSVSDLASFLGDPILPVLQDRLPAETAAALEEFDDATIIGGPVAVSEEVEAEVEAILDAEVERLAGEDRFGTSQAVAEAAVDAGLAPWDLWFATGANFPDAIVAGPVVAGVGGILSLVDPDALSDSAGTEEFVADQGSIVFFVQVLGGTAAVSAAVERQILDLIAAGDDVTVSTSLQGYGYVRLFDTETAEELAQFAVEEALDEDFVEEFAGHLSVHKVKTDPDDDDLAYLSYYLAGLRVVEYDPDAGETGEINEVGAFIAEGGNDFWGVFLWDDPEEGRLLALSDRDSGLWILRYTPDGDG
jgi:putative cell wall-binding protein